MIRRLFVSSLALFFLGTARADFLDLTTDVPFFKSEIEARVEKIDALQAALQTYQKNKAEASNNLQARINNTEQAIDEVDTYIKSLTDLSVTDKSVKTKAAELAISELVTKRRNKLVERKQNLINILEVWGQGEDVLLLHIKLIKDINDKVKEQSSAHRDFNFYSLSNMRKIQAFVTEYSTKLASELANQEALLKQKKAIEDSLISLNREVEELKKERNKIVTPEERIETEFVLKEKALFNEVELSFLNERKEFYNVTLKKIELGIDTKKDETTFLERQLGQYKSVLSTIPNRLLVSKEDVNEERKALEDRIKKSLQRKEEWDELKKQKKEDLDDLKKEYEANNEQIKEIKEKGKIESPRARVLFAQQDRIENNILLITKQLELFGEKKELENSKIFLKELTFKIVELRYKIQTEYEKINLEKSLMEFSRLAKTKEDERVQLEEKQRRISIFIEEMQGKIDSLQIQKEELRKQKAIFRDEPRQMGEIFSSIQKSIKILEQVKRESQSSFSIASEIIRYKKDIINQYGFIIKELESRRDFNIWKRSPQAISLESIVKSSNDFESFINIFFWRLPLILKPSAIINMARQFDSYDVLGLGMLLFAFLLFFFLVQIILKMTSRVFDSFLLKKKGVFFLIFNILNSLINVFLNNYRLFAIWLFLMIDMRFDFRKYLGTWGDFLSYTDSAYLSSCFYILSIPFLILLSNNFILSFKELNKKRGFEFFTENFEHMYIALFKIVFYSTAILLPFRQAFILLVPRAIELPTVIYAVYTIILQGSLVILALIHKNEVLGFISSRSTFLVWIRDVLNKQYRPALSFLFFLFVLANPYIGYFNLAYMLLYTVPLSILFLYALIASHEYMRINTASWFLIEEDGDYVNRFDHAKAYYGFFIAFTFLLFALVTFLLIAKIWGVSSVLEMMYDLFRDKWVLVLDAEKGIKIGLIEFVRFAVFVAGGFIVSTFLDKLILQKLFDVVRMDYGVRNTISSISHYAIIYISIVMGMASIHLGEFVKWATTVILIGVGFAAKDFLSDFIAGLLVLLERPIEIGSFIETAEFRGTVYKITARSTTIRTALQRMIIIPNKDLIQKPIINWTYGRTSVGFDIDILISFKNDPEKVKKLLSEIISNDHRVLRNPPPIYRVEEFEESGFKLKIRCFTSSRRAREKWDISSDIRRAALETFSQNNITIPYPQRDIYIKDKNEFNQIDESTKDKSKADESI